MNNDNTFWLVLWLFILMAAVAIALGMAGIVTAHYDHMAELGYEETPVPGQCSPVWKKVAPAKIEVKCNCRPMDSMFLTITNRCQAIEAYCTTNTSPRNRVVQVEPNTGWVLGRMPVELVKYWED